MYKIRETREAIEDVSNLAIYIVQELGNQKAGIDFLNQYNKKIDSLKWFPLGYRGTSYQYRGYAIRIKPYDTYNIFFVADAKKEEIIVLRVLKDRQNWKYVISKYD